MSRQTDGRLESDTVAATPMTILAHPSDTAQKTYPVGTYRIAGDEVITDLESPWLVPFRYGEFDREVEWPPDNSQYRARTQSTRWTTSYEGKDWIGNEVVSIRCRYSAMGYQLEFRDSGEIFIQQDGSAITCHDLNPKTSSADLVVTVLGAPFLLASALRDTWSLHGSAVSLRDGIVAFVGESGLGKSTMARFLCGKQGDGLELAGDDILPVSLDDGRAVALPRYPQLKLPPDEQPGASTHTRVPLLAICLLAPPAADAAIQITRLSNAEGALAIAANSAAARLFGRHLLTRNLEFCARMAVRTPVYRLEYPRVYDALPRVRAALLDCLTAQAE